jgi:Cof subfamily protein (haloacid dehalogenase superfamily)
VSAAGFTMHGPPHSMTNIYFFDIDNTLLDHRTKAIPRSAVEAIADLKRQGHTIVVATGRSYAHSKIFADEVEPDYVITQNGARILRKGQEVLSLPLARKALAALFEWIEAQGHGYGVNHGASGFVNRPAPCVLEALGSVAMPYQSDDRFYLREDAHQAWLFFDAQLDAQLFPEITRRYPDFDLVRWHQSAVDVMPHGVNKWTGCQWVLRETGYAPQQAIAFGDGLNDLEMLKNVGLGIAMDNGHPDLKVVAKRIAPALHLDGIALMLEELTGTK